MNNMAHFCIDMAMVAYGCFVQITILEYNHIRTFYTKNKDTTF